MITRIQKRASEIEDIDKESEGLGSFVNQGYYGKRPAKAFHPSDLRELS